MGKSRGLRRVNFSSSGAIQTTCGLFLLVRWLPLETEATREHLRPRLAEVEGGARVLEGGDKDRQMDDAMIGFWWLLFRQLGGTEFTKLDKKK